MSWADIVYLALVIVSFTGFAGALAYFSEADAAHRARSKAGQPSAASTKDKDKSPDMLEVA